ncbi:MAG: FAD-dependent oxidoreductase [Pseudomonadota bacterium]|nr:FAD-dependent oxidoreductase [Pseudomonadota bacterium]
MSRRDPFDVVVVGAGVVGATAALVLARDGRRVALVEACEPAPWRPDCEDLRVYALAPDNAALLDGLGVWQSVRAERAQPYRRMRVWDAGGGGELAFDADALGRRELGWIVEHALLVDRLWAALPAAGVRVLCPEEVTGLEQDDALAELQLASGTRLHARWVVAADGARSRLRGLAGIGTDVHDYGQSGLVAYVETQRPHAETCWQRFLPGGPLAFLPDEGDAVARHRSSIVWTLPRAEAARLLEVSDQAFLAELGRAFGDPLGAMLSVSRRVEFPLSRQTVDTYLEGRVVLVGDAAHVVHPLAGQGVNLGMRDVTSLRAVFGAAGGETAPSAARLQRWARARRSENELAARAFDGINRVFSNDSLALTLLRGPVLGLAGRLPALTHALWQRAAGL